MNNKSLPIILIVPVVLIFLLLLINNNEVNRIPTSNESEEEGVLSNMGTDNEDLFDPGKKSKTDTGAADDTSTSQQQAEATSAATPTADEGTQDTSEENQSYTVTLTTTEGDIKIKLSDTQTPKTVANFVKLAKQGFYDGTIFHRVMEDFMIQGGDPKGDGTGGPGYTFDDEPFEGSYTRGTVAMANGGPNTNGSQFFIMHKDYALPKNYVIFGQVTEGMEIVDKIATAPVTRSASGELSQPVSPVSIESAVVEEN